MATYWLREQLEVDCTEHRSGIGTPKSWLTDFAERFDVVFHRRLFSWETKTEISEVVPHEWPRVFRDGGWWQEPDGWKKTLSPPYPDPGTYHNLQCPWPGYGSEFMEFKRGATKCKIQWPILRQARIWKFCRLCTMLSGQVWDHTPEQSVGYVSRDVKEVSDYGWHFAQLVNTSWLNKLTEHSCGTPSSKAMKQWKLINSCCE